MTHEAPPAQSYRGNRHRNAQELRDWHARHIPETAMEPWLPLVDPHHHLYGRSSDVYHYTRQDLDADLNSGHRVMGTVYLEAYGSGWRAQGPAAMQSTGEVEMIVDATRQTLLTQQGPCQLAAGIVSNVDLTLGDAVQEVIQAHLQASGGRLRGVRHHLTHDDGTAGRYVYNQPPGLASDPQFRKGFACLQRSGLSFDAFIFHTQLADLLDLAQSFPDTRIVVNHVGTMIRVAEYAKQWDSVRHEWDRHMSALARQPNIFVKLGGLGMPIFGFGFEQQDRPAPSMALASAWQALIDRCIELFGSSRCMFESNFPVDKQSCGYAELWNAFKIVSRHRSKQDRKNLFYKTACTVYRLPDLEQACDKAYGEHS